MRKIKHIHERSFHASYDDCKTRIYADTYIYGESRKYISKHNQNTQNHGNRAQPLT